MADALLSYLIEAKDKASPTFRKVAAAAKALKGELDDTSKAARRLTDEISDLNRELTKLGDASVFAKLRQGQRDLDGLGDSAKDSAGDVAGLNRELDKTRDAGSRLTPQVRKADEGVSQLGDDADNAGKKLAVFSRIGVTASNGLNFFATAATDAGGAAKFAMHPLGATAIAVGAIGAGALVGGAALAGFGAGLIGMGALALRNSQAAANAMKNLGATVDGVGARSARVLESDFVGALNKLSSTAKNAEPALTRMFTNVAPAVGELAGGLDGLVGNSLPGLERASAGARDVLGDVAEVLPQLGDAVSDFGESLGGAADGGGQALVDTLSVLGTAIRNTGNAIEGTAKAYSFIKDLSSISVGDTLGVSARRAADEVERLSQKANASKQGWDVFATGANMAKAAVEAQEMANLDLAKSMQNVSNMALALAGSEIAAIDSRHRMVEVLKDGARTLDKNTDAGRRNLEAIHSGIAAAIRYGEAETKRTGNTAAGTAAQQRHTDAMYNNAVAVMKDKGAVDALWRSLGLLPPSKAVKVAAPGASAATAQVHALRSAVYNLPTFRRLSIVTEFRTIGRAADVNVAKRQGEALEGRAVGGPVRKGQPYVVGEKRPELFVPDQNGTIMPRVPSASGAGGGGVHNHYNTFNVNVPAGASAAATAKEIIHEIQRYEKRNTSGWRSA